ncbi:T-cell surface antigen CD2 [Tachysurus ichikawai]
MVTILAGGGTLVLLLIIVLVTLSCRSCKRKEKHQRDEEEFRLNYLSSSLPPQKGKQTARGQPAPPEPINNGYADEESQAPCQAVPRPRNQQRARPPPPPIDDGEEPPPPLPQPRKKAHVKKQAPM